MQFFEELKRRNVIRVGFAYLVAAWLIIQVAETLFPVYGLSDAAIRLVVTILALGMIPAVVLAWVFERTPEGIKLERDVDRSESITTDTRHKLDRVIIAVLVVALGYFAFDKFFGRSGPAEPVELAERSSALEEWNQRVVPENRKSIAVLPFTNMSGDPANEPFTLGIHDDLLTHLSRIDSLATTSRTSVLQYRGTTKSVPEIGAELDVSHILEGGIQRSGNRVRINLQLIDVATDEHLWAEIYDRELTAENLFSVQAEVANEVASSLEATLLPAEERALEETPTRSMAAYDLYLLGRHHQETRTEDSLTRSVEYFRDALEEDPNYVLAHAGLAQSTLLLVGYGSLSGAEALPQARQAIDAALALDDSRAEVWATQGLYYIRSEDNPKALEALERAIELDIQSYHAWLWYANALLNARRNPEHLEALEVAYSLEPMSYPVNNNLAGTYKRRGDFVRARHHYERVDQIDDESPSEWKEQVIDTHFESGAFDKVVIGGRDLLAFDPANVDALRMVSHAYANLGMLPEAERWADEAEKIDSFQLVTYRVLMAQGAIEDALAYLEDKGERLRDDPTTFDFLLFQSTYFAGKSESARDYLNMYLDRRGGRLEVNPGNSWQWDALLVADFLMRHGSASPGGPARGQEMLEETEAALSRLIDQGFHHPNTWFGLAMARSMAGDVEGGVEALNKAVTAGFNGSLALELFPQLDGMRPHPQFQALQTQIAQNLHVQRDTLAQTTLADFSPLDQRPIVTLPRELLETYSGYYTDGNMLIHIYVNERGQFTAQPGLLTPMELIPVSDTEFYLKDISAFTMKVVIDEAGAVKHLLTSNSGTVERAKVAEAPPPVIELPESQLQRFVGNYSALLLEGAGDGTADTDIWAAEIYLDDEGQMWIDFDNQPALRSQPYSETGLFVPGFLGTYEFDSERGSEQFDRITFLKDGREIIFRKESAGLSD